MNFYHSILDENSSLWCSNMTKKYWKHLMISIQGHMLLTLVKLDRFTTILVSWVEVSGLVVKLGIKSILAQLKLTLSPTWAKSSSIIYGTMLKYFSSPAMFCVFSKDRVIAYQAQALVTVSNIFGQDELEQGNIPQLLLHKLLSIFELNQVLITYQEQQGPPPNSSLQLFQWIPCTRTIFHQHRVYHIVSNIWI